MKRMYEVTIEYVSYVVADTDTEAERIALDILEKQGVTKRPIESGAVSIKNTAGLWDGYYNTIPDGKKWDGQRETVGDIFWEIKENKEG